MEVVESSQGGILYVYSPVTGRKTDAVTYPAGMSAAAIRLDRDAQTPYQAAVTRTVYTYDALGRLAGAQVVRRNGRDVAENATAYTYNAVGSRESVTLPNQANTTPLQFLRGIELLRVLWYYAVS